MLPTPWETPSRKMKSYSGSTHSPTWRPQGQNMKSRATSPPKYVAFVVGFETGTTSGPIAIIRREDRRSDLEFEPVLDGVPLDHQVGAGVKRSISKVQLRRTADADDDGVLGNAVLLIGAGNPANGQKKDHAENARGAAAEGRHPSP